MTEREQELLEQRVAEQELFFSEVLDSFALFYRLADEMKEAVPEIAKGDTAKLGTILDRTSTIKQHVNKLRKNFNKKHDDLNNKFKEH